MTDLTLAQETIRDLLRAAWLIERARMAVYEEWAGTDRRYAASAERSGRRAEIVAESLSEHRKKPDERLLAGHTDWMRSVVGATPREVPLANFFIARLGDWVDGHASGFVARGEELKRLGDEERSDLAFPSALPDPPPFERVPTIEPDPPGEVVFRFAILGDLHFGSSTGETMARAAIKDINRSGAELVIQLGDLTDRGQREEFELATEVLRELDIPVTTMLGNHDIYSIEEDRLSGREYYGQSFGREPDGVLLEHKGFRFAVLDSATSGASPFAPFDFVSGTFLEGKGGAVVHGSLTVPQHEILAEIAGPGSPPAFVFMHHPPQPFTGFPPVLFGLRDADSGRLHATCDSGNVWGVFAGHTHRNKRTAALGPAPAHEVAIPRDFPYGYALVDVTRDGYSYRFVQLSDEELLRSAYPSASILHRRYALGSEADRAFSWTKPPA